MYRIAAWQSAGGYVDAVDVTAYNPASGQQDKPAPLRQRPHPIELCIPSVLRQPVIAKDDAACFRQARNRGHQRVIRHALVGKEPQVW